MWRYPGVAFTGISQKGNIMTSEPTLEKSAISGIRTALGIAGVLAIIAGLLILFQPARAAFVVTAILGVYAIAAGLVYAGLGIFAAGKTGWARVGHIVLGVLLIVAGIVAFANLAATTALLAVFVAVFIGIGWIIEGVVSLSTLGDQKSKVWTVIFAIISIVAGVYLLFTPLLGAVVLWWILGIALLVMGVLNLIRAFSFGK